MKIDLLITELNVGGAERHVVELAVFLKLAGHDIVVYSIAPPPSQKMLVERLSANSINVEFLGCARSLQIAQATGRLRKLAVARRPDLAHSFLFHANVLAAMVYPGIDVPLIGGHRVAEPARWRQIIGGFIARRMKAITCVSHSVSAWCQRTEHVPAEKLVVIQNGIDFSLPECDLSRDVIDSIHLPKNTPILLFVGRLHLQKGVDRLISMTPRILSALPDHHLLMIGDGPLKGLVQQSATKEDSQGRLHYLGWQANPRIWMSASRMLLLPARFEGMPNVVLEAMAEGKCISATQAEGVMELLGPNSLAQTCALGDWEGWLANTIRLARSHEERERIGAENQQRAIQEFDLKTQLAKYDRLYSNLLQQ